LLESLSEYYEKYEIDDRGHTRLSTVKLKEMGIKIMEGFERKKAYDELFYGSLIWQFIYPYDTEYVGLSPSTVELYFKKGYSDLTEQ
jgi:hypothetical protein